MLLLIKKLLHAVNDFSDRFRQYPQGLLSGWFDILWNTLEKQDKLGRVIRQTWYQTGEGLKTEGQPSDQPIYNVKTLRLPEVTVNRRKFFPRITQTTISSGIFPETIPEIETWILGLNILDKKGGFKMPPVQFYRYRFHSPDNEIKYEIKYTDGKQLTDFQVSQVKTIYDAAVEKLGKNRDG